MPSISHFNDSMLKAIGGGARTLTEISDRAFIPTTSVNFYLNTIQELRLVERRLPVTQPRARRANSKSGRYHLSDPYFRFYFQFLEPFLSSSPFEREQVIEAVRRNLRSFVGRTAFEELARNWVWTQARAAACHSNQTKSAATGAAASRWMWSP